MRKPRQTLRTSLLDPSLWGPNPFYGRSADLTPLYVCRYVGPRTTCRYSVHDFWELTYVFHGRGELYCQGNHALRPGVAFLIPPDLDHYEYAREPMDTVWIGLQGSRLPGLDPAHLVLVECSELELTLERLWLTAERTQPGSGPELDALTGLALTQYIRLAREKTNPPRDFVDQAIQWLHRNFDRQFTIATLAAKFGYSEGYFYRAFHRHTGKSPVHYLTELRVRHALHALTHTTMTIDKIARLVGYPDPLYFSRIFRKLTGRCPRQMRKTIADKSIALHR